MPEYGQAGYERKYTPEPTAEQADQAAEAAKEHGPEIGTWSMTEPNVELLKESARLFIQGIGEDPTRSDLVDTPDRVAKMYAEIYSGYFQDPKDFITDFDNPSRYHGPVILKGAELYSTCAHHFQPFIGEIDIAYAPNNRLLGLSKLVRVARVYAKRLQTQETLTQQVADALNDLLDPEWVIVRYRAEHYCMRLRGVRIKESTTTTIAWHGRVPENIFNV